MIKMLWKSWGSVAAYYNALLNWRFKFLAYAVLLIFVSALFATIPQIYSINKFIDDNTQTIASQMPDAKIKDNILIMPTDELVFVKSNDDKNLLAFTSGFIDYTLTDNLFMAFEKDRISIFAKDSEMNIFYSDIINTFKYFSKFFPSLKISDNEIAINGDSFLKNKKYLKVFLFSSVPSSALFICFFMCVVFTLALSLPVYISTISKLPNLGYIGALKISLLAATPSMILQSLEFGLGYDSSAGFIYALLSFIIAWRVVRRLPA